MQQWDAHSHTGKPFERIIIINPTVDDEEKSNILSTISTEGYLGVESLSDNPPTYRVRQDEPTHESKHLGLLALWRARRSGAIKYKSEENESC